MLPQIIQLWVELCEEFSAEDFTNAAREDVDSTIQDEPGARDHYLDVG